MLLFCCQCEEKLADKIVEKMKEDCEAKEDDLEAIRDLFDNIEAVCELKGFQIEIPTDDNCQTTVITGTTSTPMPTTIKTRKPTTNQSPKPTTTQTPKPTTTQTPKPPTTQPTTQTTSCVVPKPCDAMKMSPFLEVCWGTQSWAIIQLLSHY